MSAHEQGPVTGNLVLPATGWAAILRGLRGRCPRCGEARLFMRFLKPIPHCPQCGQDWTHQQADDFPAYVSIFVTGHLMAPLIIALIRDAEISVAGLMAILLPLALLLMIGLLQPAKGAIIALQWWFGMHGFRKERPGGFQTWHVPNGDAATEALSRAFFRLTDFPVEDREHVPSETLAIKGGRELFVPKSLKGVAVLSFKRLCGEPRGIPDYLALAHRYHTVILVGIPILDANRKSEAARFKTLIDAFYENGVKLLASADRDPDTLYCATDDAFEFERTISRLNEMGSQDYLARGHGVSDEVAPAEVRGPSTTERLIA